MAHAFTCRIPKVTNTCSEYVMIFLFHGNDDYVIAPECCVYLYFACLDNSREVSCLIFFINKHRLLAF